MKKITLFVVGVLLSATLATFAIHLFFPLKNNVVIQESLQIPSQLTSNGNENALQAGIDFTFAADKTTPAVVHIKSSVTRKSNITQAPMPSPFREFFGDDFGQPSPKLQQASGSGVIISQDGYIVTNNHVVEDASQIEVSLNDNRTYDAVLIGTDPSTDLAVIKINEQSLQFLAFANSDDVRVGSWALAVGNPLNLASTVTAGIISAKARNINILRDNYAIESFLQTDAAINRGNSGGALVNLNGDLIGINTAIATPTGTYTGYAFAVPSNIVKKVTEDLIEFGTVQRGFLGVMIRNVDGQLAEEKKLKVTNGVYVDSLTANSAAYDAGIQKGDIIIKVDGEQVLSSPELQEKVGRKRPGESVLINVLRDGKEKEIEVVLNNRDGKKEYLAKVEQIEVLKDLGIAVSDLSDEDLDKLKIEHGVSINKVGPGKISQNTGIKPGFVVTKINKKPVRNKEDLVNLLESEKGGVMLEGVYPNTSGEFYYAFGMK